MSTNETDPNPAPVPNHATVPTDAGQESDVTCASPDAPGATSASIAGLRAATAAIAFAVVTEAALGFAGALAAAGPVIVAGLAASAIAFCRAGRSGTDGASAARRRREPWTAADAAAALILVAALATRAWDGLHREAFTYDVLSYHLHLPASWRAAGRVGIVPTPFGDQAPAYAPSNAELIYQLALAATGNVRVAHAGQLPFAALGGLAIAATARSLGASRLLACGGALVFLLVPEIWQQAASAMTDLALASFFLAALPPLVRLARRPSRVDALGLALALGLLLGTKYVGAILLVPLVASAVIAILRSRVDGGELTSTPSSRDGWGGTGRRGAVTTAAMVVALIVASGGFWYVRNVLATGNPFFPVALRLGPFTLLPGLYDARAMRAWTYHWPVSDLQPLLDMFIETGWGFLAAMDVAFAFLVARGRPLWPSLFLAVTALGWLVVPYQQSRFLFATWGVAAVMLVTAARALPAPRALVGISLAILVEALQFPTPARLTLAFAWTSIVAIANVSRRAGLDGLEASRQITRAVTWPLSTRARRGGTMALLGLLVFAGIGWARARPDDRPYAIGDDHDAAWAFVRDNIHGRHIAYAGSNLPLPLWGWRLENDVRYVNVAGAARDLLYDFARGADGRFAAFATAEPAPERARPDRQAWLANLASERIDVLFVAALYPEVRPSMSHDGDGFPIERAWADADPDRFELVYTGAGARIYLVRTIRRGGGAEAPR